MNKRVLRKIIHFLILFAVLCFKYSPLLSRFAVSSVLPDPVFSVLFVYALWLSPEEAVADAALCGTFADLIFGKIFGVTALIYIALVCLLIFLNHYIYCGSSKVVVFYAFLTGTICEMLLLSARLAAYGIPLTWALVGRTVGEGIYTALLTIPVFLIARAWHNRQQEVRG